MDDYLLREFAVVAWVRKVLEVDISPEFWNDLKDGVLICQLMEELHPHSIPHIEAADDSFILARKNISYFFDACLDLGVDRLYLFQAQDLYLFLNIPRVVRCLELVAESVENDQNYTGSRLSEVFSHFKNENRKIPCSPARMVQLTPLVQEIEERDIKVREQRESQKQSAASREDRRKALQRQKAVGKFLKLNGKQNCK